MAGGLIASLNLPFPSRPVAHPPAVLLAPARSTTGGKSMKPAAHIAGSIIVAASLFAVTSAVAQAPTWTVPPDSARCPSKWGAGDERGAANQIGAKTVLNAAKLIKTGEVIELSHVLHQGMPISTTRRFEVFTKRTTEYLGTNKRGSNEELVVSEIGQVGTQFDGFAHQTEAAIAQPFPQPENNEPEERTGQESPGMGAGIVVFVDWDLERLRALISHARTRLAGIEAEFTAEKSAVDAMSAALFRLLRDHYQRRDRLLLFIDYRRKFLDALLSQGEEEARQVRDAYQQARQESDAEY
jgi:hypothetical protein